MSAADDLSHRMHRCVVAAEPAMGSEAATAVCRQAIYGSRGLLGTASPKRRRSGTRRVSGGRGSLRSSSGGAQRRRTASRRYSRGTGQ